MLKIHYCVWIEHLLYIVQSCLSFLSSILHPLLANDNMVLTRTGKSTCQDFPQSMSVFQELSSTSTNATMRKGHKRVLNTKTTSTAISSSSKATFTIFMEPSPLERDLEAKTAGPLSPAGKKARVLTERTNVHLNTIMPTVDGKLVVKDVKKVSISSEEKAMNGAPEGDLYDVVLLEDSALFAFESSEKAAEELSKQLAAFPATTVWAEKYEIITTFRRIVLHHNILLADTATLKSVVNCVLDSIASLRSSNVRNGLLCLRKAAHCCEQIWSVDNSLAIFNSLLNKSGNGPKFLCDTAFETAQCATEKCPIERLIPALQPFLTHKNMEVSCKAIQLLTQSIQQLTTAFLQQLHQSCSSNTKLTDMLSCLSAALNAKKALGKEKAKEALRHIKEALGADLFDSFIDANLTATQSAEIKREVKPTVAAPSATIARPPIASVFRMKAAAAVADVSSTTVVHATKPWERPTVSASNTTSAKPWSKPAVPSETSAKPWLKPAVAAAPMAIEIVTSSNSNAAKNRSAVDDCLLPAIEALKDLDELL